MANRQSIVAAGDRFGRWTVIREAHQRGVHRFVLCRCDCGSQREVKLVNLRDSASTSCGCQTKELAALGRVRHGNAKNGLQTPEYRTWQAMIQRCSNPKRSKFQYYGGRGIKVCACWRNSFEVFLADMGQKPSPKHSIDRYPNNDGDYEPGNCRWATREEQRANQRPINHNPRRVPQHH